jgi:hypothetical protein
MRPSRSAYQPWLFSFTPLSPINSTPAFERGLQSVDVGLTRHGAGQLESPARL